MRIAVVGSGVAGMVAAYLLRARHQVTLYEADERFGGHSHTVDVTVDGVRHAVDTAFMVCNERTYPNFTGLLAHLGVTTNPSDMSFSVSDEATGLEWRGSSLSTVFAQPRNMTRAAFHRMLVDVVRFNRAARSLLTTGDADPDLSLGRFVAAGGWSRAFVDWYLVPMGSAIWSADPTTFDRIPAVTFARFFDNHGLLRLGSQPQWRTVDGGARRYADRLLAPLAGRLHHGAPVEKVVRHASSVELRTADGEPVEYDHVVLACHSDQALAMLGDPTPAERDILGAIRYQPNSAVLHTDDRLLPRSPRARASWNFHRSRTQTGRPTVTYDLNRLQGVRSTRPLLLTLNRDEAIDGAAVVDRFHYEHPVLDAAAVRAQSRHGEINARQRVSYAGAYWGYGFHEDGVVSAVRAATALGAEIPW